MENILENLKSINFWENKPDFQFGFVRKTYLKILEEALGNKLIKVITGQRRAGKSFIIRQFMQMLIEKFKINPLNILYLNKELFEFEQIKNAENLSELINAYQRKYSPEGKIYIIIDEVQNITDWEKIIVSISQNNLKNYEVIITGSNSGLLSGELASLLSGRYIVIEVLPFSYKEFLEFYSLENNKSNFIKYYTAGGLPEVYNLNTEDIKRNYFQSLKDTVLLKDIMYRHNIRDYVLLGDLFLYIIHNVGNMTSIPSIIKYFKSKNRKVDYATAANFISYMEDAYLIHRVQRFSIKTRELLSGERKYFINDIGFRNYLYPHLSNDIDAILENIVFLHLRRNGYDIKLGFESNFEIDFYAVKSIDIKYIQVSYLLASDKTLKREFGALEKIKDNFPKYVLSMDDLKLQSSEGIIHETVWDFLYNLPV
jgi:predicted AAA+ superfamily ATPase